MGPPRASTKVRPVLSVELANLRPEHADATLAWVSNPMLAADIGLSRVPDRAGTEAYIERAGQASSQLVARAIIADGVHIGNVAVDCIDRRLSAARYSVYIGEARARGQGYGRAATRLALGLAFGTLALNKVWLIAHVRNTRAIAMYAGCGFREEGLLREEFLLADELVDAVRMGILAREFSQA